MLEFVIEMAIIICIIGVLVTVGPKACERIKAEMETPEETEARHEREAQEELEQRISVYDPSQCRDRMFDRDSYRMTTCPSEFHSMEVLRDSDGEESTILCKCDLTKTVVVPPDLREAMGVSP